MKKVNPHKLKLRENWQEQVFLHHTGFMFGVGCSAFNNSAIDKINRLKHREGKDGMILLLAQPDWLKKFGLEVLPELKHLLHQFWPGNLTVIAKDTKNLFEKISYNGTVACRVPLSSSLQEFMFKVEEPIISTSVNVSGSGALNNYKDIIHKHKDWFDFVVWENFPNLEEINPSTIVDLTKPEISCLREGSIPFYKVKESVSNPMILFVCTGNTCRSPMAEYYGRYLAEQKNLPFIFKSCGSVSKGHPISINSAIVLQKDGIDAKQHVSSLVNRELVEGSFLILTMAKAHRDRVLRDFPEAVNKTFLLSEFCGEDFCRPSCEIADPIGLDLGYYQHAYAQIKERIEKMFELLKDGIY